jgi:hypothetical protein
MQATIRPDTHYLLIAPNLGAEWLFDAARNYVIAFRPIILADLDFVAYTPANTTVTVTAVARRDTAAQIGVELAQVNPYAFYDAVVRDTFEDTKVELDRRAAENQPFGVPMGLPTASAAPGGPSIPTPWPTPDGPTPTPSPTIPVTPLPTSGDAPAPLQPTPGPILGGG